MRRTKIEWCDATWNPVTGCLHACEYCYARRMATRFGSHFTEPDIQERVLLEPVTDGEKVVSTYPFDFLPTFHRYRLDEPHKWKKPRNIFVCSMADLFGNWVPDEWIEEVFAACERAPQHRYLFLTKNPVRYVQLEQAGRVPKRANHWYGTTMTGPGNVYFYSHDYNTFVSVEPIMESFAHCGKLFLRDDANWVILGAETGNRRGKVIPEKESIDNIVRQCQEEQIPVFMKDSLLPLMGEANMRREFPWETTDFRR